MQTTSWSLPGAPGPGLGGVIGGAQGGAQGGASGGGRDMCSGDTAASTRSGKTVMHEGAAVLIMTRGELTDAGSERTCKNDF